MAPSRRGKKAVISAPIEQQPVDEEPVASSSVDDKELELKSPIKKQKTKNKSNKKNVANDAIELKNENSNDAAEKIAEKEEEPSELVNGNVDAKKRRGKQKSAESEVENHIVVENKPIRGGRRNKTAESAQSPLKNETKTQSKAKKNIIVPNKIQSNESEDIENDDENESKRSTSKKVTKKVSKKVTKKVTKKAAKKVTNGNADEENEITVAVVTAGRAPRRKVATVVARPPTDDDSDENDASEPVAKPGNVKVSRAGRGRPKPRLSLGSYDPVPKLKIPARARGPQRRPPSKKTQKQIDSSSDEGSQSENAVEDEEEIPSEGSDVAVETKKDRKRKQPNVEKVDKVPKKVMVASPKKVEPEKSIEPIEKSPEKKLTPKKRKAVKGAQNSSDEVKEATEADASDDLVTKRKKADQKATKNANEPTKTKANATDTNYSKINFQTDKEFNLKICSWNVAGLRAVINKNGFDYFEHENPDIICLQVNSIEFISYYISFYM